MFSLQAACWKCKVLATALWFFKTGFSIGRTIISLCGHQHQEPRLQVIPCPQILHRRRGWWQRRLEMDKGGCDEGQEHSVYAYLQVIVDYLINLLKTNLPTDYCWKFQLLTFPFPRDCSSKWIPLSFHWILPFLDTSFPQPFLTRMQFWLRSALDLNLVNPLPLGTTKLWKACLHVVLINQRGWAGEAHILRNIFVQKLQNETWWQTHQGSFAKE